VPESAAPAPQWPLGLLLLRGPLLQVRQDLPNHLRLLDAGGHIAHGGGLVGGLVRPSTVLTARLRTLSHVCARRNADRPRQTRVQVHAAGMKFLFLGGEMNSGVATRYKHSRCERCDLAMVRLALPQARSVYNVQSEM